MSRELSQIRSVDDVINDPRNEYVAILLESIRWIRLAKDVRKYGWHEMHNQFIGRVERASSWKGHTPEGKHHLQCVVKALTLLYESAVSASRMVHPVVFAELQTEAGTTAFGHYSLQEWVVDAHFAIVLDLIVLRETKLIENCQIADAVRVLREACERVHHDLGDDGPVRKA